MSVCSRLSYSAAFYQIGKHNQQENPNHFENEITFLRNENNVTEFGEFNSSPLQIYVSELKNLCVSHPKRHLQLESTITE